VTISNTQCFYYKDAASGTISFDRTNIFVYLFLLMFEGDRL